MSDFWNQFAATPSAQQGAGNTSALVLYPITGRDLISVSGPDSAKFMQGQFTCNLNDITPQQFRRGACCTPKGRMVTSFTLVSLDNTPQSSHYLMAMDKGLGEITLAHLNKYRVFFKTQLTPSDWVMMGLSGPAAEQRIQALFNAAPEQDFQQLTTALGAAIKLPFNAGYELWLNPEHATATINALLDSTDTPVHLASDADWQANLIQAGLAHVTPQTTDELIPQMLNLGETGGISFKKGCYTGQEIVARMQYLGKLKRHLYRIAFTADVAPKSNAELRSADKASAVGHLVNVAALTDNQWQALAVLEDQFVSSIATLSLDGCSDLELLDLPYNLTPAKQEG